MAPQQPVPTMPSQLDTRQWEALPPRLQEAELQAVRENRFLRTLEAGVRGLSQELGRTLGDALIQRGDNHSQSPAQMERVQSPMAAQQQQAPPSPGGQQQPVPPAPQPQTQLQAQDPNEAFHSSFGNGGPSSKKRPAEMTQTGTPKRQAMDAMQKRPPAGSAQEVPKKRLLLVSGIADCDYSPMNPSNDNDIKGEGAPKSDPSEEDIGIQECDKINQ